MNRYTHILTNMGQALETPFLLAVRLIWGWSFLTTGLSKLQNISSVAEYFGSLGIPFPTIQATMVGSIEMVAGTLLLVGFCSRFASLALICTMMGALYFAHYDAISHAYEDIEKLFIQTPFSFIFASLVIFVFGPGKASIDYMIEKN